MPARLTDQAACSASNPSRTSATTTRTTFPSNSAPARRMSSFSASVGVCAAR